MVWEVILLLSLSLSFTAVISLSLLSAIRMCQSLSCSLSRVWEKYASTWYLPFSLFLSYSLSPVSLSLILLTTEKGISLLHRKRKFTPLFFLSYVVSALVFLHTVFLTWAFSLSLSLRVSFCLESLAIIPCTLKCCFLKINFTYVSNLFICYSIYLYVCQYIILD